MGRSRWGVPISLLAATLWIPSGHLAARTAGLRAAPAIPQDYGFCLVELHPAGAPGTTAGLRASRGVPARLTTPGEELWVHRYNGPANDWDQATALGVSPDGSMVFVTGKSTGSTGYPDYETVAYETSTGHRLWVRRYMGPGEADWDRRFDDVFDGSAKLEMVRFTPETVVVRDQSYRPTPWAQERGAG